MAFPLKTLKLGGMNYSIVESKDLGGIVNGSNGEEVRLYGMIDYGVETIHLESDTTDNFKKATIWHEALHHVFMAMGVDLGDIDEEKIIEGLALHVHALLKDNPDFVALYTEQVEAVAVQPTVSTSDEAEQA